MNNYDPKVTLVDDEPLIVTPEDRARAMWLLRKYTSLTYIHRMSALFANFVSGYEDFSRGTSDRVAFHRENLASFYQYRSRFKDGIEQLEQGYTVGYASILVGCGFASELRGRRFEFGLENKEIGFRWNAPPVGLYAWADVAATMASRIAMTLDAKWAFPSILDPSLVVAPFPASIAPEPPPFGRTIPTGQVVPTSGIWRPIDVSWGCPTYFWTGRVASSAVRANKRLDYPPSPGQYGKGIDPAYTDYEYADEPVRWQLLWEDHRYDHGTKPLPEEEAFLDPSTEPPQWPPVHAPPN